MQHVIVTGAAGGIGSHLVTQLVSSGARVSALDFQSERLDEVGGWEGVNAVGADVTKSDQVRTAVSRAVEVFGTPDAVVNVAGDNRLKPLAEITDDDWRYLIDANLTSAFLMCREVAPLMEESGGRIVNFASIFGLRGATNDAAYSAAKAGVVGLTRALATELAPKQITVNAIAPVVVLTERVKKMGTDHLQSQLDRIPLGRFSTVDDIAHTVLFLLGPGGAFYTGQTFSPNGGDLMP